MLIAGLRDAVLDALAVALPVECAGCGVADRGLCSVCRSALDQPILHRLVGETPTFAALSYESTVQRSILALKERGRTDVARELARPLAAVLDRVARSSALLMPSAASLELVTIPPSRAARRRRGYDPVTLLLAKRALRPARVLRRVRSTATQKALTQGQRAANRSGSLEARRSLVGRVFIVVDDVVTTGATVSEAVRAILTAGGQVVAAVALAATPRRDGDETSRWETSW